MDISAFERDFEKEDLNREFNRISPVDNSVAHNQSLTKLEIDPEDASPAPTIN